MSLQSRVRRARLELSRLGRFARDVVRGLFVHHAFDHAATMAFYFFVGAIPLLVLGGAITASLIQREGVDAITTALFPALPSVVRDFLRRELADINEAPTSLAPVSLIGFLWLTSNGFHNLMDVFEFLIDARPRPWWKQRLIALGWVAGILSSFIVLTWLLLAINGAFHGLDNIAQLPFVLRKIRDALAAGWRRAGVFSVFTLVTAIGIAVFYRVGVVHPARVRRRVLPGTAIAVTLGSLVSWLFSEYVRTIGHYAVYYGSLATVAVTLLWLYLTSLALVIGAEVNAQLEGVRKPVAPRESSPALEDSPLF